MAAGAEEALIASIDRTNAEAGLPPFEFKTIPQGAATSIWAAVVAQPEEVAGRYCEDCQGVGQLAVDAVLNRDGPVIFGTVLFSAAAVVAATFTLDVVDVILDPRLRSG